MTAPQSPGPALLSILAELEEAMVGLMTCDACGCLCLPAEHCPGCRSLALEAAS